MLKRRALPPPEKFTIQDVLQIIVGLLAIPLGAVILVRAWMLGGYLPAVLVGGAFLGFGVYRTLFAIGRIRWYLETRRESKHG